MALEVLLGHAERVDADVDAALAIGEGGFDIAIDLIHIGVGHRVTADRFTFTVDHQISAGIALRFIVIIRETDIDRPIILAVGFQMARVNAIKAFRTFKVAFTTFRTQSTG